MNRILLLLLMLLVVISPLPLGSNREWSWTLLALVVSIISLLWLVTHIWRGEQSYRFVHPLITALFLLACGWAVVQTMTVAPAAWHHPLWGQVSAVLGTRLPGMITVSAEDTWTGLLRLLAYGLVFFLAFQLGRERSRAHAMMRWLVAAGLVYGVFGLIAFWSDYNPQFLFGGQELPHHVRATFVNRNHFATWQGLTLLCAIALFHMRMFKRSDRPYELPQDRAGSVEQFILRAWKPLLVILLMTTALLLTHSRGGFASALLAVVVLLLLLDSRSVAQKASSRLVVIAALAVSGIAFYLTSEVLLDRLDRTDISTEERVVVFENVKRGIAENPVLGFGYGTFSDSFRLYDRVEMPVHFDRAHNTWLENLFELGLPAALALFAAMGGLAWACFNGVRRRHRDWALPATGVAATVLVASHAMVDFSLQIPAVAVLYACIMGLACAQSRSSEV